MAELQSSGEDGKIMDPARQSIGFSDTGARRAATKVITQIQVDFRLTERDE